MIGNQLEEIGRPTGLGSVIAVRIGTRVRSETWDETWNSIGRPIWVRIGMQIKNRIGDHR